SYSCYRAPRAPHSVPTRRSSDLTSRCPSGQDVLDEFRYLRLTFLDLLFLFMIFGRAGFFVLLNNAIGALDCLIDKLLSDLVRPRSEEHTSELQSRENLVCRLLLD